MNKYQKRKRMLNDLRHLEQTGMQKAHVFKVLSVVLLLLIVNGSYIVAFALRYGLDFININNRNFEAYMTSVPILTISSFVLVDVLHMTSFYRKTQVDMINMAIKFVLLQFLATTAAAFFVRAFAFPRGILIQSSIIMTILISLWGILGLWISRHIYSKGKMVVVGQDDQEIDDILSKVTSHLHIYHTGILGRCYLQEQADMYDMLDKSTEIMLCPSVPEKTKSDIILYATERNKVVFMVPSFFEMILWKAPMVQFDDTAAFMIDRLTLTFEQRLIKRLFDILFSLAVLALAWPVMLIAYIGVRIDSPGPGVYKQKRVTLNGKIYDIYKFRTMRVDAEKKTGPVISGLHDPRVTPIGRILRRSKIDELPQFLNVLKGDMSIVGPRSEREIFVKQFEEQIPGYSSRFKVKAGITGYAQISGSYDTVAEDKLRYDLAYIKNYSILLDLRLIAETFKVIITPKLYNHTFKDNLDIYKQDDPSHHEHKSDVNN